MMDWRAANARWTILPEPPNSVRLSSMVATGEYTAALFGGYSEDLLATAQLFDARATAWHKCDEWQMPMPSLAHSAVLVR